MLDKLQIKQNNCATFHQQIKLNLTWLSPLGYKTLTYSFDTVTKALLLLPYALWEKSYKFKKDSSLIDGSLNLMSEKWLEKHLKVSFKPTVDVAATQDITYKKDSLKSSSDSRHMNNIFYKGNFKKKQNSVQDSKSEKDCKDDNVQFPKTNNLKQTIKCW